MCLWWWWLRACRGRQYLFKIIRDRLRTCISSEDSVAMLSAQFNPLIVLVQIFRGVGGDGGVAAKFRRRGALDLGRN